jgi:hypothetical protein
LTLKKNYKDEIKELEEMYLEELQPFGSRGYNKEKEKINNIQLYSKLV